MGQICFCSESFPLYLMEKGPRFCTKFLCVKPRWQCWCNNKNAKSNLAQLNKYLYTHCMTGMGWESRHANSLIFYPQREKSTMEAQRIRRKNDKFLRLAIWRRRAWHHFFWLLIKCSFHCAMGLIFHMPAFVYSFPVWIKSTNGMLYIN